MTNGKVIRTHVRLLAMNDLNLQKITKDLADARVGHPKTAVEGRASKRSRTSE